MWCESQGDGAAPAYTVGPSELEVVVDDQRRVVTEPLLEVDLLAAGRGCDARCRQVVIQPPTHILLRHECRESIVLS